MNRHFIEDEFELDEFRRIFINERDMLTKKRNLLARDRVILKAASFIIMIVSLALGSLLYTFLSGILLDLM